MYLSERVVSLVGQPMFGLLTKAKELERQGKTMYHFELGDTDFNTPNYIKIAAVHAIGDNHTHYVSPSGIPKLKEAAIAVTERSRKFKPTPGQILVTPGANIQIYLALACLCDTRDRVAIPLPYFPSYVSQAQALGIDPYFYESIEHLSRAPHSVKAIIFNSPNNPTGKVYAEEEIRQIYTIAEKRNICVISDEVYSRLIYKGKFFSPSMIDKCLERSIVVNGFSKSFAMSGWRLGVVTGPEAIIAKMTTLQETILSCVPPFIQMAGQKALMGNQAELGRIRKELIMRKDVMSNALTKIKNLVFSPPDGGLYFWVNIESTGMSSKDFADKAMELGVVVAPGTFFGVEGFIRMCFGQNLMTLVKGVELLGKI